MYSQGITDIGTMAYGQVTAKGALIRYKLMHGVAEVRTGTWSGLR